MTAPKGRRARLLAAIRRQGGEWNTSRVQALYRAHDWAPYRATARDDLAILSRLGHLVMRGENNGRFYTLNHHTPEEGRNA